MNMNPSNSYPLKWITKQVAVGYAPRSQSDIDALRSNTIDAVLNLCAECFDLHEIEADAGFSVHWLPVNDEGAPELDDARDALKWLDTMLAEDKKVLVHCRFGIGRTGTLVLAWLLKQGYTLEDAQEMLEHTPARPTSRQQWDFLHTFSIAIGNQIPATPCSSEKKGSRLGKFFRKYMLMQHYEDR